VVPPQSTSADGVCGGRRSDPSNTRAGVRRPAKHANSAASRGPCRTIHVGHAPYATVRPKLRNCRITHARDRRATIRDPTPLRGVDPQRASATLRQVPVFPGGPGRPPRAQPPRPPGLPTRRLRAGNQPPDPATPATLATPATPATSRHPTPSAQLARGCLRSKTNAPCFVSGSGSSVPVPSATPPTVVDQSA
jgi:hypothetical protein